MSPKTHSSTPQAGMNPITRQPHPCRSFASESVGGTAPRNARLQIIHELIRSGDYNVPAIAIADRMVEQMMIERRERES